MEDRLRVRFAARDNSTGITNQYGIRSIPTVNVLIKVPNLSSQYRHLYSNLGHRSWITYCGFSKFIMNSNCNFNNSEFWQGLSDSQQELIQGGTFDTYEVIDVKFSYDKIDISIMGESSPGGASVNEIRWDDRAGMKG